MSGNTDTPVETAISTTKKEFEDLINGLKQSDYKYNEVVRRIEWEDELGSFRVWANDIGFGKSGRDAVDSRISRYDSPPWGRNSSGESIQEILEELRDELREVQELVGGTLSGDAGGEVSSSGVQGSDKRQSDFHAGGDDESDSSEDYTSFSTEKRLQGCYDQTRDIISTLKKWSLMISEHLAWLEQRSRST